MEELNQLAEQGAESLNNLAEKGMTSVTDVLNINIGGFSIGKLLSAVMVFIVGMIIVRFIMKLFDKLIDKTGLAPTIKGLIKVIAKFIVYFLLAIIVADSMGINTSSLVAMFGVVGLAFSLAVENSLANVASGIIIAITKPFKDGDWVEIGQYAGTVERIGLMYTNLRMVDNRAIHMPNSSITSSNIINYTENDKRMINMVITASYDSPVQTVRKALLEAADAVEGVLHDPPVFVNVKEYGDSSISYYFRLWVKTENYWKVNFPLTEEIKTAFDRNGVEMTYNHLNVHIINDKENA